jgi:hypothetical protein
MNIHWELHMQKTCFVFAALLAAGFAGAAAAQGATGFPMGDVGQVLRRAEQPLTNWSAPPGPLNRLSTTSKAWISAETKRQAQAPREPLQVLSSVEAELQKDVLRRARRERIPPKDYYNAILFQIMLGAEDVVERSTSRAGGDLVATQRLTQARANREWVGELQSQNSLYMATK